MSEIENKDDEPEIVLSREEALELIKTMKDSLDSLERSAKKSEQIVGREDTMSMKEIGDELKKLSDAEEASLDEEF